MPPAIACFLRTEDCLLTYLLGGAHIYYGERWQSTATGYKTDDFSYLSPLRFNNEGLMQRMSFIDDFELSWRRSDDMRTCAQCIGLQLS